MKKIQSAFVRLTLFVCGLFVLLAITLWALFSLETEIGNHSKITADVFDRLRPGMSEVEIQALIGSPAGDYVDSHLKWQDPIEGSYFGGAEVKTIGRWRRQNEQLSQDIIQKNWSGNEFTIDIQLDPRSRMVAGKLSITLHRETSSQPTSPTLLEKMGLIWHRLFGASNQTVMPITSA